MKRQNTETESLVYAYGCGKPVSGWEHVEREAEKMADMWDMLVVVDREYDQAIAHAARQDNPVVDECLSTIGMLSAEIGRRRAAKEDFANLVAERRALRSKLWAALGDWRKTHRETVDRIEQTRRERVTNVRKAFTIDAAPAKKLFWANSNAVIQRYDSARKGVRQFGRRLQPSNVERMDGCLTVQIQRTRSGLGALPQELQDGTVSLIGIGLVSAIAHDDSVSRGDRRRACRTVVEMRVDAEGHMVRLPLFYHRPLPDCRVKQAQLVWRGGEYRLCLTISRPRVIRHHGSAHSATVMIAPDVSRRHSERHPDYSRALLHVAHAVGTDGHCEAIVLDEEWMRGMDRIDHLPQAIKNESLPASLRREWAWQRSGQWARLLRRRREIYRLAARALALRYRRIIIETPYLAAQAQNDRGLERNSIRHRACAHSLIAEIEHQARKHGCEVAVVVASAPVTPDRIPRKIRDLSI